MAKLKKDTKKRIEKLVGSRMVNNYHKNLLKGMLHNSERNNLQKADMEILPLILNSYAWIE